MENQADEDESEQLSDSFVCCVCLDLLYKPIVLSCGHVACFWCVHISMNGFRESHCPICRRPYHHFPTVCQMLHFLLLKMYPITYKRREKQVLEEETKMGFFSPNFDGNECSSRTNEELNSPAEPGQSSDLSSTRKGEGCANIEELESSPSLQEISETELKEISTGGVETSSTIPVEEKSSRGACEQVSVADLPCAACKQLLFRPVVLNCGHVYCETCIIMPVDDTLRCQVCQSPHPGGFPKVYLELHHFMEEKFPTEYALRKCTAQPKEAHLQQESQTTSTCKNEGGKQGFQFPAEENLLTWWGDNFSKIHFGAGCDSCGMYPIVGDRYRCKDCVEVIGFDLCGDCYNTRSKLPGRFNQQHTPEHRFENVKNSIQDTMLTLWRGQSEDGYTIPNLPNEEPSESLEILIPPPNEASESAENDTTTPNDNTLEDQSDNQPPCRPL
ncbi:hypothetical protein LguiA_011711 [Lonicera macranthoides]